jgi:uncharacterized membrane protein YfhO
VRIVDSAPQRVVVDASLLSPGFVVLAATYYPGWRATVDGQAAPIFPTDVLFRGVYAGAGRHQIVLTYEPELFRLGLALAALTLMLCFVWWKEFARS